MVGDRRRDVVRRMVEAASLPVSSADEGSEEA